MAPFRRIPWGLLLLGLSLCGVPCAALAYFLLALGAAGLVRASPRFRTAALLSWAALIWSLVSVWLLDLPMMGGPRVDNSIPYFCVRTPLDCVLIWTLLGAIGQYAAEAAAPIAPGTLPASASPSWSLALGSPQKLIYPIGGDSGRRYLFEGDWRT